MNLRSNSWRYLLVLTATCALGAINLGRVRADDPLANSEIWQKLDALHQRADQLDKDGKHEDAQRIRDELRQDMAKLSAAGSAPSSPDAADIGRHLEKARQRADQLDSEGKHEEANRIRQEVQKYTADIGRHMEEARQRADQLDSAGQHEEADRIRQEIKKFTAKLSARDSAGGDSKARSSNPSTKPVEMSDDDREKLQAIRRKVAELEQNGQREEAARLKQEAKQIYTKYYPQSGDGGSQRRPSELSSASPCEIASKLDHLRVAVDHLRAAGFEGEANHIREIVEKLEHSSRGDGQPTKSSSKSPSTSVRTVSFGEQNLRELGSKDGHVLTRTDFLASAKARGKDVSKAESSWNSLTGSKDSVTLDEFQQKVRAARVKAAEKQTNP